MNERTNERIINATMLPLTAAGAADDDDEWRPTLLAITILCNYAYIVRIARTHALPLSFLALDCIGLKHLGLLHCLVTFIRFPIQLLSRTTPHCRFINLSKIPMKHSALTTRLCMTSVSGH